MTCPESLCSHLLSLQYLLNLHPVAKWGNVLEHYYGRAYFTIHFTSQHPFSSALPLQRSFLDFVALPLCSLYLTVFTSWRSFLFIFFFFMHILTSWLSFTSLPVFALLLLVYFVARTHLCNNHFSSSLFILHTTYHYWCPYKMKPFSKIYGSLATVIASSLGIIFRDRVHQYFLSALLNFHVQALSQATKPFVCDLQVPEVACSLTWSDNGGCRLKCTHCAGHGTWY